MELLHPYSDPATLTLLVTGADGKPVAQGRAAILLEAPEPGRFFSTDFPLVEGSRLLEMDLPLRQGRAEWKYLFPIRGQYRLTVEFIAPDGRKMNKTFPLAIRENKQKWFFLGIFTMGLLVLGVFAGRIFTGALSHAKRRGAVCLLVSMSCVAVPVEVAAQELGQQKYFGWLEVDPATVGKPSSVRWRLAGEANAESRGVSLTLTIAHLEKGKTVFAIERLPVEREFTLEFPVCRRRGVPRHGHRLRYRRAGAPDRAKHIRHRRGAAGAGDDSRDRVFSRGDCVRFGNWKMEPPGGPILSRGSFASTARTSLDPSLSLRVTHCRLVAGSELIF